jgi:hypothetical protein
MTEKMVAALALVTLGVMDMFGMILLSCMEKPIPDVLVTTSGIVVGGLLVLGGVNGGKIVLNGRKKNGEVN